MLVGCGCVYDIWSVLTSAASVRVYRYMYQAVLLSWTFHDSCHFTRVFVATDMTAVIPCLWTIRKQWKLSSEICLLRKRWNAWRFAARVRGRDRQVYLYWPCWLLVCFGVCLCLIWWGMSTDLWLVGCQFLCSAGELLWCMVVWLHCSVLFILIQKTSKVRAVTSQASEWLSLLWILSPTKIEFEFNIVIYTICLRRV